MEVEGTLVIPEPMERMVRMDNPDNPDLGEQRVTLEVLGPREPLE